MTEQHSTTTPSWTQQHQQAHTDERIAVLRALDALMLNTQPTLSTSTNDTALRKRLDQKPLFKCPDTQQHTQPNTADNTSLPKRYLGIGVQQRITSLCEKVHPISIKLPEPIDNRTYLESLQQLSQALQENPNPRLIHLKKQLEPFKHLTGNQQPSWEQTQKALFELSYTVTHTLQRRSDEASTTDPTLTISQENRQAKIDRLQGQKKILLEKLEALEQTNKSMKCYLHNPEIAKVYARNGNDAISCDKKIKNIDSQLRPLLIDAKHDEIATESVDTTMVSAYKAFPNYIDDQQTLKDLAQNITSSQFTQKDTSTFSAEATEFDSVKITHTLPVSKDAKDKQASTLESITRYDAKTRLIITTIKNSGITKDEDIIAANIFATCAYLYSNQDFDRALYLNTPNCINNDSVKTLIELALSKLIAEGDKKTITLYLNNEESPCTLTITGIRAKPATLESDIKANGMQAAANENGVGMEAPAHNPAINSGMFAAYRDQVSTPKNGTPSITTFDMPN